MTSLGRLAVVGACFTLSSGLWLGLAMILSRLWLGLVESQPRTEKQQDRVAEAESLLNAALPLPGQEEVAAAAAIQRGLYAAWSTCC